MHTLSPKGLLTAVGLTLEEELPAIEFDYWALDRTCTTLISRLTEVFDPTFGFFGPDPGVPPPSNMVETLLGIVKVGGPGANEVLAQVGKVIEEVLGKECDKDMKISPWIDMGVD